MAALQTHAQATGRIVVAYPNSGEKWVDRQWIPGTGCNTPLDFASHAKRWVQVATNGVAGGGGCAVGGCCRTSPATIKAVREALLGGAEDGEGEVAAKRQKVAECEASMSTASAPADVAVAEPSKAACVWEPRTTYHRIGEAPAVEAEAAGVGALVTHSGGCHCGAVRFECDASARLIGWDCNCSVCFMKRNVHFIVPEAKFRLQAGSEAFLSEYTFNTKTAKHTFCRVCGVVPFYRPRSNPDGYAVTVHCLDPGTVEEVEVKYFDGGNWEQFVGNSGIRELSKE